MNLLLWILAAAAAFQPPARDPRAAAKEEQLIGDAEDAVQRKHLAVASGKLKLAIEAQAFEELPSTRRHHLLELAGDVAMERKDWPAAHSFFVRATELLQSTIEDWSRRADAAYRWGYKADYVASLTYIARLAPARLRTIPDGRIFWAIHNPPTALERDAHRELLDALFDANWTPRGGDQPDAYWRRLARLHLDFENERAAQVAARIVDPYVLASMRIDRRFAFLVERDPAHYDIDKAVAAEIGRSHAAVASHPRSLAVLLVHLRALIAATRYKDAFDLAGDAIARSAPSGSQYDDVPDLLASIHDERSEAAQALGRWDDSAQELERGRQLPEEGKANVSQSIDLGELYCSLDRPRDALRAVAAVRLGDLSGHGRMLLESVRHEAAVELGDRAGAAKALAWMRDHERDGESALQAALIMTGQLHEGFRVFNRRLAEEDRARALLEVQEYAPTPATPRMQAVAKQWAAFLARRDVAKTIATVGRIERFNLPPPALVGW